MPRNKIYDAQYFECWYRKSDVGVGRSEFVGRKVRLAVAAAEYLLGYKIKSVLDVGCGEGPWRAHLKKLRPGVRYAGMDASEYAVNRYGRARDIRLGTVGALAAAGFKGKHDLLVCADVLHYVPTPEVCTGLAAMHALCVGVAFIEAFTNADAIDGDRAAFQKRTPAQYRALFADAGFTPVGLHLYATLDVARTLVALERPVISRTG